MLVYLPKGVFSSTLHTLAETPSLSHVTAMWGPPVSSIPFLPHRPIVATRRLRPPHAARPPTSRCQARSSLHALTPHQSTPPSMVLSLLPPAVSPSPAPVCPSTATIKGRGAPPGHHHTHLALNRLLPSLQRPLHRAPPPPIVPHRRPVVSDPPPPLLQLVRVTSVPSPFFLNRGEVPRPGTPFWSFSGEPFLGR
jgi:hypothetical protein